MKMEVKSITKFIFIGFAAAFFTCIPAQGATEVYIVGPGDSLWQISEKYQLGLEEVIGSNPHFADPNLIFPGDRVYVPTTGENFTPQPDQIVFKYEEKVLNLVNAERAKNNLFPLKLNTELSDMARLKCQEMRDLDYFSHISPVYGTPFEMLKNFSINYKAAGENIGKGQKTPEAVFAAWMNSDTHRGNILSPSFTEVGIGFAQSDNMTYWTQTFIIP